ncbi:hypothetical protein [Labrenzia sp. PHM005]|uniref:hypothetical protein n=1 Tax=Labrenzia sp. PHM005 TaxID=2590016 RepID=UPI00114004DB|nr:hypothetical protein [Labrenzia sp. PHM005]QDG75292.1 hypothetical protein FJ695_05110 [Labrenzia sp. PHM005]
MPEGIGYGSALAFRPSLQVPRIDQVAEQAQTINAKQSAAVAETVQRQANFSANRAEALSRQAEQLQQRAQPADPGAGLGNRLDISV